MAQLSSMTTTAKPKNSALRTYDGVLQEGQLVCTDTTVQATDGPRALRMNACDSDEKSRLLE